MLLAFHVKEGSGRDGHKEKKAIQGSFWVIYLPSVAVYSPTHWLEQNTFNSKTQPLLGLGQMWPCFNGPPLTIEKNLELGPLPVLCWGRGWTMGGCSPSELQFSSPSACLDLPSWVHFRYLVESEVCCQHHIYAAGLGICINLVNSFSPRHGLESRVSVSLLFGFISPLSVSLFSVVGLDTCMTHLPLLTCAEPRWLSGLCSLHIFFHISSLSYPLLIWMILPISWGRRQDPTSC